MLELLEWLGADLPEGGDAAFLGGRADPWNTHWDLMLALIGALMALALSVVGTTANWRNSRLGKPWWKAAPKYVTLLLWNPLS